MSDQTTQATAEVKLSQKPNTKIKSPNQSVDAFLTDADNLSKWCLPDKPKLMAAGLDETLFDLLPEQIAACRKAQISWIYYRKSEKKLQTNWKKQSKIAFDLRDTLIADFKYAFRNDATLLELVADTAKHKTITKKIQDLNDLAVLGRSETAALSSINFDTNKLEQAADFVPQISTLYALINKELKETNELLLLRNQSYTALLTTVSEIRKCGVYVFRKDKLRQQGYRDEQRRKRYLKRVAKNQNTPKETTTE
jgi:hypothetical protein